jgi:DNA-binding response OmpR family regulator
MENSPKKALKLIVIEDNIALKTLVKRVFENHFSVETFDNGLDALAYLQKGNIPDIIITDIFTPLLDGHDLLAQLKASTFFNEIPVIILSSDDRSETRVKCLELGADDYVIKPFNPRELEARINVILKRYGKGVVIKP